MAWLQHPPAHFFFFLICVVQHQVLYTGQTVLKEIRQVSSSGWWTCKSLWFGADSPNCIQPLTTIVSLQPPSSIRTSTRTGTWVHTGGEEVAGFTSCRGLAQGPSYDWLGDWDMSLSMISFTVKGDKQKKILINIQNFKYIILSEHLHFFPAEVSAVPPWVPHRTKIANSNCQKIKMEKENSLKKPGKHKGHKVMALTWDIISPDIANERNYSIHWMCQF